MAPAASSLRSLLFPSVTQTAVPSKTAPCGPKNPAVTVVTVHGIEAPGVTIETEPIPFAVHTRLRRT